MSLRLPFAEKTNDGYWDCLLCRCLLKIRLMDNRKTAIYHASRAHGLKGRNIEETRDRLYARID